MKLMTKMIESKLLKYPISSALGNNENAQVLVKYYNPCGDGIWLIIAGDKLENDDWLLYGLCHLGHWDWGYVLLSQLGSIPLPYGCTIERDVFSSGSVSELRNQTFNNYR